jgi:hypothetical protein
MNISPSFALVRESSPHKWYESGTATRLDNNPPTRRTAASIQSAWLTSYGNLFGPAHGSDVTCTSEVRQLSCIERWRPDIIG